MHGGGRYARLPIKKALEVIQRRFVVVKTVCLRLSAYFASLFSVFSQQDFSSDFLSFLACDGHCANVADVKNAATSMTVRTFTVCLLFCV